MSRFPLVAMTLTTLLATASPVLAEPADQGGDATSVLKTYRPPPVYRPVPRRPYYRPVPRRVYVAPVYTPRPRRPVEVVYNPHFHISIGVNGTSVLSSDGSRLTEGLDTGGGFDIGIGWRLGAISLDASWMMSFHNAGQLGANDEATLGTLALDARFFLSDRSHALQPYLQLGVGLYVLGRDSWDSEGLTGVGVQVGGGVDFYVTKHVSIGGKLLYRGAHLDNSDSTWSGFPSESTWLSAFTYGGDLKFHF